MLFKSNSSDELVEVVSLRMFPQGGGFVREVSAEEFFSLFSPCKMPVFFLATVQAEWFPDGLKVECFSDGARWNGWGKPYFEKDKVIYLSDNKLIPPAAYDEESDCFITDNEGDVESFQSVKISVEGREVTVYPVGAGSWCWDACEKV